MKTRLKWRRNFITEWGKHYFDDLYGTTSFSKWRGLTRVSSMTFKRSEQLLCADSLWCRFRPLPRLAALTYVSLLHLALNYMPIMTGTSAVYVVLRRQARSLCSCRESVKASARRSSSNATPQINQRTQRSRTVKATNSPNENPRVERS